MKYYAVAHGHKTGVFYKWQRRDGSGGAKSATEHFPNAQHKAFPTLQKAKDWLELTHGMTNVDVHKEEDADEHLTKNPAPTPKKEAPDPAPLKTTTKEEGTPKRTRSSTPPQI